jgi:hypothetical protein
MFFDRIKATVTLTIKGTAFTVPAGALKKFEIEILPWGFRGSAEWWFVCVSDPTEDTLFTPFVAKDLVEMEISLARAFDEVDKGAEVKAVPIDLKGLVLEKGVLERSFSRVEGAPVLQRRYTIRFADRGAALWRQHRPSVLYVDKAYKDLLEDNKPDGVTLAYSWSAVTTVHPILAIGLGTAVNDASYYDFLFWLCNKENVGLYYDPAADKYTFMDAKPTGTPAKLDSEDVGSVEAYFSSTRRGSVSVLNSYTDAATAKQDIANAQAVTGVRTDYVIRSSISSDLTDRVTLETSRAKLDEPRARVEFKVFPAIPLFPSTELTLGEEWSTKIFQNANTYRVISAKVTGEAVSQEATDDMDELTNRYKLDYALDLELDADPAVRYPPFVRPAWPFYVEGKVLSETGADDELTFQPYNDATTSLDYYKVKIPLYANQQVIVPYEPVTFSGHFFFPLIKDERVLVALGFDKARIRSFLDWRPSGRLPTDTQGNHLLVGKKDKNITSISHTYADSIPTLTILRTLDTDTQTITITEGMIRMETKDH